MLKANALNPDEKARIATVARMFFVEHRPQSEIAKLLKTNQSKISRLVKQASDLGIAKVIIDPAFSVNLEEELRNCFPYLRDVIVVPLNEAQSRRQDAFFNSLGMVAAKYFIEKAHDHEKVGLSCGVTVRSFVESVRELNVAGESLPSNMKVYPLITMRSPNINSITSAALVASLVRWLPQATGKAFQLPSANEEYDIAEHSEVRELQEEIENLDFYMVGVGVIDTEGRYQKSAMLDPIPTHEFNMFMWNFDLMQNLIALRGIGEALYQPFTEDGKALIDHPDLRRLKNSILYLRLDKLREIAKKDGVRVIALAGGRAKHKPLFGALEAKLCNVVITDSITAYHVIQRKKDGGIGR